MIILAKYVLLTVLLCSCSSGQRSAKDEQADIHYAKGSSELLNAEYTNALISLKRANELRKKDTKILNNLGMAYYFKNDLNTAKKHLQEALDADPENMDAKSNLAALYMQEDNLPLAEKMYAEITKVLTYQNQFRILYNLGIIQLRKNNDEKAIEYFEESLKADSNYCSANYQLGLIYKKRKNLELALENFKTATKGNCYQYPAPHYAQALTFLDDGQYQMANEKFQHIIKFFPNSEFAKAAKKNLNSSAMEIIRDNEGQLNSLELPPSALKQNLKYKKNTVNNTNSYSTPTF